MKKQIVCFENGVGNVLLYRLCVNTAIESKHFREYCILGRAYDYQNIWQPLVKLEYKEDNDLFSIAALMPDTL